MQNAGPMYRPTSLDFINRPNPVEPQSVPQNHPLNRLAQSHDPGLVRVPFTSDEHASAEKSNKRRRSGAGQSLDLPKLPVRHAAKRLRIPPTLSGLHQPPPNAGLLPSISTEQPKPTNTLPPAVTDDTRTDESAIAVVQKSAEVVVSKKAATSKPKRKRWSDEETTYLLKGVSRFGIGSWTKILKCEDYSFNGRTALDLKDRFRVCCPDEYQQRAKQSAAPSATTSAPATREGVVVGQQTKTPNIAARSFHRKSRKDLQELGIESPFVPSQRRKRHGYSAEEDEAILKGFEKHGNAWAVIRSDVDLGLEHRTPTDLRDRMRTKFPEMYLKAGLTPRPDVFPKPALRVRTDGDAGDEEAAETSQSVTESTEVSSTARDSNIAIHSDETAPPGPRPSQVVTTTTRRHQTPFLTEEDSVFWGAGPFEDEDLQTAARITLDRGILDWPGNNNNYSRPSQLVHGSIATTGPSIPSMRLADPELVPLYTGTTHGLLPSVAAITAAGDANGGGVGNDEQLELPSLMLGGLLMGGLDVDGGIGSARGALVGGGHHFLGFDELLS